jgi:DTW domain-containing protein YfiP
MFCRLRCHECVCDHAPRLRIATRLFVIVHSKEWRKTTNTGHLARLAIDGGAVHRYGVPHRILNDDLAEASPSTLVLFPGRGAVPLTAAYAAALARPVTLLVPDGNWNQTRRMTQRLPMLRDAHAVSLPGSNLHNDCLRRNHHPGRMSTFEAIAQALGVLEGPEVESDLLRFFERFLHNGIHNSRRGARRHKIMNRSDL